MFKEVVGLFASKIGVRCQGQPGEDNLGQCGLHTLLVMGLSFVDHIGVFQSIDACPTLN